MQATASHRFPREKHPPALAKMRSLASPGSRLKKKKSLPQDAISISHRRRGFASNFPLKNFHMAKNKLSNVRSSPPPPPRYLTIRKNPKNVAKVQSTAYYRFHKKPPARCERGIIAIPRLSNGKKPSERRTCAPRILPGSP